MANKIKTIKSHDIEKLESDVNQFLESNNIILKEEHIFEN